MGKYEMIQISDLSAIPGFDSEMYGGCLCVWVNGIGQAFAASEYPEPGKEDEWTAKHLCVPLSLYLDWKRWVKTDCQCRGFTRKGKQCLNNKIGWYIGPNEYDPEETPYCKAHLDPSKRNDSCLLSERHRLPRANTKTTNYSSIPHRYGILKAAGFRCQACGAPASETRLHLDHIYPSSKGGTDDLINIQVLCESCNCSKGDRIYNDAGEVVG